MLETYYEQMTDKDKKNAIRYGFRVSSIVSDVFPCRHSECDGCPDRPYCKRKVMQDEAEFELLDVQWIHSDETENERVCKDFRKGEMIMVWGDDQPYKEYPRKFVGYCRKTDRIKYIDPNPRVDTEKIKCASHARKMTDKERAEVDKERAEVVNADENIKD